MSVPGSVVFDASTPGRRADEAVVRLADHERRADAHDALRLAEDRLDPTRISLVARDLARTLRRLDVVEPHDATLDLRDRLLRDDDDVAVLELDALEDQRREVVPFAKLGNPVTGKTEKPRFFFVFYL